MSIKHRIALTVVHPSTLKTLNRLIPTRKGLYIFLWHDITDSPSRFMKSSGMYTTITNFEAQIDYICKNFKVISPKVLSHGNFIIDRPLAIISFDDAWFGMFEAIVKVLQPRGILPIMFLNIGTIIDQCDFSAFEKFSGISSDNRRKARPSIFINQIPNLKHDVEFQKYQGQLLSLSHLKHLEEMEIAYFANHLFHHFDCRDLELDEFIHFFEKNRTFLKQYTNFIDCFAFPYGDPEKNANYEQIVHLRGHKVPFFWANQTYIEDFSTNEMCYGRIGIRDESIAELWIKSIKAKII